LGKDRKVQAQELALVLVLALDLFEKKLIY